MCAVTKVADASGLVTPTLSQLAQTKSVVKNNYTKRKGSKVIILTGIKQKENNKQNNNNNNTKKQKQNMAKSG